MEERRKIIRELEDKKRANIEARNQLLEGLGETLLNKMGNKALPFDNVGEGPGGVLAEYRGLKKEIAESGDIIKSLEADALKLKDLEKKISAMEDQKGLQEKELDELYGRMGKALLEDPDLDHIVGESKQHEEHLLSKIEEHEGKLGGLDAGDGNIFKWLGRNAQMAVSKTLLLKNQTALRKLYRNEGEKLFSAAQAESVDKDAYKRAVKLKNSSSFLAADLALKKGNAGKWEIF